MIPNYQIQQQSLTPEELVDVVPELEKSNQKIQQSEEAYLRQLEDNNERSLKNYKKNWEGLADISSTFADILKKKEEKFRKDRANVLAYKFATEGIAPELEAEWRGDREELYEDSLKVEEFAVKLEKAGDPITADEFRGMAGWEQFIIKEEWARSLARSYPEYRLNALKTTTLRVVRNGQEIEIGGGLTDPQGVPLVPETNAEREAIEAKMKFEFSRKFSDENLGEALIATVVKPELDAYDNLRRKKQILAREKDREAYLKQRDEDLIKNGFITANQSDGYNNAHRFAKQYSKRNETSLAAGRTAFKDNLISLVKAGDIDPVEVGPMLLYEEEANDGSMKSMTSWKEWEDLPELLAEASVAYKEAETEDRDNQIALDVQNIRSRDDWTNDEKAILTQLYKDKYDGRVPSELQGALAGHEEDYLADERLADASRRQGGILYDYQLANVSNKMYDKYSSKIRGTSALTPGTADAQEASKWITAATNTATGLTIGEDKPATVPWLNANSKLTALFNKTYQDTLYDTEGNQIATPRQAFETAKLELEKEIKDPEKRAALLTGDYDPASDNEAWQNIVSGRKVGAGGNWKTQLLPATDEDRKTLMIWSKGTDPKTGNLPEYYIEVAKGLQISPYDLAQRQLSILTEGESKVKDRKADEIENNHKRVRLIYGYPTRSRQTRAVIDYGLEVSGQEQNAKTSIYNKQAITTPGV